MNRNKTTVFNIASTIILQGLAFFSGPIFSGVLGTDNYGIASVYYTWVQLACTVFSLQAAGTVAVARVNYPIEDQEKYQSSVLSLATFTYLAFSVITLLITFVFSSALGVSILMVIAGLIHGWGMYVVSFMNSKFTYEFKADKNFVLSVTASALTIGLSLFLINKFPAETNYWGRIIGQSSVYGIIGLIMYIFVLRNGRVLYDKDYWKFTLPIAIPTVFHLLAHIVLNQSDKIMLGSLASPSATGIYSLAFTFSMVINTIYSALNNSWVPYYYEFTRQGQIEEMKEHARNYMELYTVLAMGFVLLCREVFHVYANKDFWPGTDLIPIFTLGYYFVFLYSFPVNYEFYNKKTKTIAIGTSLAAIINIILNYFFIIKFDIAGAVAATAISHLLQFLFHYYCARKFCPGDFPFRLYTFLPYLLAVISVCVLYTFTKEMWLIRWALGGVLGVYLLLKIYRRREIF